MGATHEEHYVNVFKNNYDILPQQSDSILKSTVTNELWDNAEYYYYDYYGTIDSTSITTRTQATAENTMNVERRRVSLAEKSIVRYLSRIEDIRLLADPTHPLLEIMKAREERDTDDLIIAALDGTSYKGKAGASAVSYDDSMTVSGTGSDGMILSKLKAAAKKLDEKDAIRADRYLIMSPEQAFELMDDAKAANFDYIKGDSPIQTAVLPQLAGFNILTSNRLGTTAGGRRKCFYYQKKGLIYVTGKDRIAKKIELDTLPASYHNKQITLYWHAGCARVIEDLVGMIECTE